jgi:flavin-dependent dehydrogenase
VAGAGWQARARVVIGADGRGSSVAKHVGAATLFDAGIVRATFHAYWRGVRPLPEPALELWHDGDDIVQTGPCDDGQAVVMLSCPPEAFARLNAAGADGYIERLRAVPGMAARLAGAEQVSPVYRGGALRNFHRAAAGPGWRLVGDALCHKDPLFGAGIADALAGARALAETVDAALSERCDWPQSAERYAALAEEKIAARMRAELCEVHIQRPDPGQEAWIRGVLNHPGFAFELIRGCSQLFAGLAPDRQEFWQARADLTARALGLPPAARITETAAPTAAAGAAG